jgi:hypothetical protein
LDAEAERVSVGVALVVLVWETDPVIVRVTRELTLSRDDCVAVLLGACVAERRGDDVAVLETVRERVEVVLIKEVRLTKDVFEIAAVDHAVTDGFAVLVDDLLAVAVNVGWTLMLTEAPGEKEARSNNAICRERI